MKIEKKYKHSRIVAEIAKEKDLDPRIVHLIIRKFYAGLRSLMIKNEEINIKGFFIIKLSKSFKDKVDKKGKDINLRKRKDQKYTYQKKGYIE